jgi:hypothetical protein
VKIVTEKRNVVDVWFVKGDRHLQALAPALMVDVRVVIGQEAMTLFGLALGGPLTSRDLFDVDAIVMYCQRLAILSAF